MIESGDGQRADEFGLLEDPLVVVVRDQNAVSALTLGNQVRFIARDGGTLVVYLPSGDDPGDTGSAGGTSNGYNPRC